VGVGVLKSVPTLLVLKALSQGPAHGYRIASWVNHASDGGLELKEGTLYPLLHGLERKGLIEGEWRRDERDREARVYRLTERGRRRLQEDERVWRAFANGVDQVLEQGGVASDPV
jgi:PadR family transcriptional regulator PadR